MLEELLIKFIGPSWGYIFLYTFLLGGTYQIINYFVKEMTRLERRSDENEKRSKEYWENHWKKKFSRNDDGE